VVAARSAPGWLFRSRQGSTDDRRTQAIPDYEYADVDAVIVQIELVDANA